MAKLKVACYLLDSTLLETDFNEWFAHLPTHRKDKCLRYIQRKDQLLSLGGGLLVEAYVGEGEYGFNEYGKPSKEGKPYFSLSHSGSLTLLAVCEDEVGADIERIGEKDPALISFCFDEEECARIHDPKDFFLYWCEKESLGKLLGFGLRDPKTTPIHHKDGNEALFEGEKCFVIHGFEGEYAYAIACYDDFEYEIIHVSLDDLKEKLK